MKKLMLTLILLFWVTPLFAEFDYIYNYRATFAPLAINSVKFETVLINTGAVSDSFNLRLISSSLPTGWFANFCGPGWCVQDQITTSTMAPGDSIELEVDIYNSFTDPTAATASVNFNIRSVRNPNDDLSVTFTVTFGPEIMFVDDDDEANYETQYLDFFDQQGIVYYLTSEANLASQWDELDLSSLAAIFWNISWGFPAFQLEDITMLNLYLSTGGNLFLAGQDIGWDIFEGESNFTAAQDFYHQFLRANYIQDDSESANVSGVSSDPISDGLGFSLSGVYQANSLYPEWIEPNAPSAVSIFNYDNGRCGAIRNQQALFKTVYLGFGLEQIEDPAARATIINRSLNWFGIQTGIEDDDFRIVSIRPLLHQNYPNPWSMNSTFGHLMTNITFSLPGNDQASLIIYDVTGRQVITLADQQNFTQGDYTFSWDGIDANQNSVSSGIYFYRLKTQSGFEQTNKMIMLK